MDILRQALQRKMVMAIGLYCALFLYFAFTYSYHHPLNLELMTDQKGQEAQVIIYGEMGRGYVSLTREPIQINPANGAIRLPLPQEKLTALKIETTSPLNIESARLASEEHGIDFDLQAYAKGALEFKDFPVLNRQWNGFVLVMQAILAGLILWPLLFIWGELCQQKSLKEVFLSRDRKWFTIPFVVLTFYYGLLSLGQWPSLMSPASLDVWTQIKTMHFQNWNPIAHSLISLMSLNLSNSPWGLVLIHILCTSLLFAWSIYNFKKWGIHKNILKIYFVILILAVPVIVMNMAYWRDILFSICLAFWFFVFIKLSIERKFPHLASRLQNQWLVLGILFGLTSLMRHNGAAILVLCPLLLLIFQLMPRKALLKFFTVGLVVYIFVQFGVGHISKVHANFDYRGMQMSLYLNPILAIMKHKRYMSPDQKKDKKIIEAFAPLDDLIADYCPHTVPCALFREGNNWDLTPTELKRIRNLYVRLVFYNPHIFLGHQTYMMLSAMGIYSYRYSNNLSREKMSSWKSENTEHLRIVPIFSSLNTFMEGLLKFSKYKGVVYKVGTFLMWNVFWVLLLILVIFYFRQTYFYMIPSLFLLLGNLGALYLTIISTDFRYIYWVYLFGLMALPLLTLPFKNKELRQ